MSQRAPPFHYALLTPRHWPAWVGLAAIWFIARLPYPWLMRLAGTLGWLAERLLGARRDIALRNLELCFPQLDPKARADMLKANLRDSGRMLFEFAFAWLGSARAVARVPVNIEGLEHLEFARAQGRGVLLVGAHFSHLELCARLLSRRLRIAGMYRAHAQAAFEWAIKRARLAYADAMFAKNEIRACVRYLKAGGIIWYAPDQDMRGKDSVFAPFFGVPAATITATHHLARLSDALVIPFFHRRLPEGGYALRLEPPLSDFPSADTANDTARVNLCIEQMVREAPTQYLWMHQRFKTRPVGTPPLYG
ncbi:MAG: LpxL/LpxP family Kdo(2)-lipid IV(A) lauroyl/palmitoleoyl acyltransferase [Rhodanobacteraceae bacterium]